MARGGRIGALLLAVALAGCATSASPSASGGTPEPSRTPVVSLEPLDAEPVENRAESVILAFTPEEAAALLHDVPADLDLGTHAVVCVYLGERQTTGWSLDLRTASLTDDVLSIAARETAPRTGTRPEVTYPADCGLLTRAALPPGELVVRADDTITGEFIADTVVDVPASTNVP